MLLRSRIVVPVINSPIEDGAVRTDGDRIVWVGRWKDASPGSSEEVADLGESILLPGLINAHCHLDYTDMAGLIPPQKHFADWIKTIVTLKGAWTEADFLRSWKNGIDMLVGAGVTTVADIEAIPELLPNAWKLSPIRVISFREIITLKSGAANDPELMRSVKNWAGLPHPEGQTGLSPHAPYTTTPELLRSAAGVARSNGWLLTTHVAESQEEMDMFCARKGPLYDWLRTQRDMSDCGLGSPVEHLERHGYLSNNLIAVHLNYLGVNDAHTLARRGVSVVHCPRSHDYFGHQSFPFHELRTAGVNICLGTDSLATIRKSSGQPAKLSLFAEMRAFAKACPDVSPEQILEMATLNAAKVLRREGILGQLSPDAKADMIAIPWSGHASQVAD